ncbi:MAG: potassium channel protein [Candidatus Aminicenantes bacterium]|nr:potassium channel protein [Candidatus Aminicenantes bacterium]
MAIKKVVRNRKTLILGLILLGVLAAGTGGYILISRVSFIDALYMTVISITTVGFREVIPLTPTGKIFTIALIVVGLGIVLYFFQTIVEDTLEGRIRKILGRRKMEKNMARMRDHVVVAGFGRMGEIVCRELSEAGVDFLIIENSPQRYAMAEENNYPVLNANATDEGALQAGGIEKARVFISLLSDDADNILSVITAREINPALLIIARALDAANEKKMVRAGASRVVSPYELTSHRIVRMVAKPNIVDFFDVLLSARNVALSLEELLIREQSDLNGRAIREAGFRERFKAIIVAVRREQEMIFNPSPDLVIKTGDILILIGERESLKSLD